MARGQGSFEYLILIAVTLAVAGVTILFITGGLGGQKESAQWDVCRSAANQCKTNHVTLPADTCDFCNASCSDPTTMKVISDKAVECCRSGNPESIYDGFSGTCTYGGPVNQPPIADAGANHECLVNQPCALDGSASYDTDGTITAYAWSVGATGKTTAYTFTSTGTKTVTLTVTDNKGATGTDTVVITIPTNPLPDLKVTSFTVNDSAPEFGSTIRTTAKITNTGLSAANSVVVRFNFSSQSSDQNAGTIGIGQTVTLTKDWTPIEAGTFVTGVRVDPNNAIPEGSETNNAAQQTVTVYDRIGPTVSLTYSIIGSGGGSIMAGRTSGQATGLWFAEVPVLRFATTYGVNITASAYDVSGIFNVSIYVGGALNKTCHGVGNSVDCWYNTTFLYDTDYVVNATAFDNSVAHNKGFSTRTVNVASSGGSSGGGDGASCKSSGGFTCDFGGGNVLCCHGGSCTSYTWCGPV
jgi:hypothetical protein